MKARLAAAAVGITLMAWLALPGALKAPGATPPRTFLPPAWHRAPTRLVPRLLLPRERISIGTFPMAVGGGGNCGREPVASIRRMRPGDALISIQEYAVTGKTRSGPSRTYPIRSEVRLEGLRGGPVYRATLPFRDHGRAFDALVYTAGRPTSELRDQIDALLVDLPLSR